MGGAESTESKHNEKHNGPSWPLQWQTDLFISPSWLNDNSLERSMRSTSINWIWTLRALCTINLGGKPGQESRNHDSGAMPSQDARLGLFRSVLAKCWERHFSRGRMEVLWWAHASLSARQISKRRPWDRPQVTYELWKLACCFSWNWIAINQSQSQYCVTLCDTLNIISRLKTQDSI